MILSPTGNFITCPQLIEDSLSGTRFSVIVIKSIKRHANFGTEVPVSLSAISDRPRRRSERRLKLVKVCVTRMPNGPFGCRHQFVGCLIKIN